MKDLLCQLGYVLFEEYQWNETQNLCFDNHKKKWDAIPLVLASCTNINDASTSAPLVLFQHEELWETPFWSMNGLETRPLKWIEQKKTETGRENIIELVTMSSHLLLDWMATTCSNKPEVNSIELKAWMEDILEETWDVYQSLVQHLYDDWKVQCQNHHLREQSKRHPFHLQDMTSTYLVKKNMPLKPISTWKRDTKQSTSILSSHENVLLHNTIEYDNPLDDFLDITGNEKQERIRQKYHPDLEESLHTCLQEKSSNKWDGCVSLLPCESLSDATCGLHIPKDICISKELISVAQRLVGHKSFLLLPPPLEIFLIGVVMVYHYLTAMENRPRCLWIAQDEYPFVAALLKQRIGSQLVLDLSLNKSGCFLCHLSQLSNIPRDEEFSLVIYTAQSLVDKSQVDICTIQLQWELCFPFMETADAILIDPLSKLWTIEPQQVVESILHSPCSDMLLLDMHDAQLVDQLSILRQTWIVFYPSGYQMEGMKMIEEHAAQYIEKLKNSCNVNLACNVNLNHLSTTNIENTLYKARHYIREYFQTLHACKPRQDDTDNQWSDSFLLDIQHLIALHTLRTSYDYVQHDGLYGASKYLDTAHKRYGSMLPCMKTLQNMLEDLGQVDKLLHPKTDIIVKTSKQLKHIYEQQRRCLPNFRGVPFRILVVATTRYTAYMLKRDLYNRGLKNNSGIDIVERKCVEDIRQYYAILDLTLLEWKPTSCLAFHETLSHWPIQVATQLYEWIMSQVVQYRCVIVDRNNNIQDSLLDWNRYDPLYQKILSFDLLWTKTTTTASHNKDCLYGIYGMEIGTVDVTQGLHLLLTHLMKIYSAFRVIILCCITNEPQKDRKQMIDLSTTIQLNPDFRHNFSIKFFFHSNDYERWLKSLQDMNIKCQILRDWFSSKPPAPHFHLSFKDDEDKQTKLQWKASANKTNK